jgi:predicted RNase H-like nuclease (RuvC/YqgF family)
MEIITKIEPKDGDATSHTPKSKMGLHIQRTEVLEVSIEDLLAQRAEIRATISKYSDIIEALRTEIEKINNTIKSIKEAVVIIDDSEPKE